MLQSPWAMAADEKDPDDARGRVCKTLQVERE